MRKILEGRPEDRAFPRGREHDIWSEENESDLTSLTGREEKLNLISKFIESCLFHFYHKRWGHLGKLGHVLVPPDDGETPVPLIHYSDRKIAVISNGISTFLSSVLPAISIFVLYFLHDPLARMGAVVGLCFLFSTLHTVIAGASPVDCFAATSTFASVLVVYVGTVIGNN